MACRGLHYPSRELFEKSSVYISKQNNSRPTGKKFRKATKRKLLKPTTMNSTANPDLPTLGKPLYWMKNTFIVLTYRTNISGTFANCKYEELSYHKNQKMCDPILVTLLKMRPHYSQTTPEVFPFRADLTCVNAVRWVKERKGRGEGSYERYHGHQKVEITHHGDWNYLLTFHGNFRSKRTTRFGLNFSTREFSINFSDA